MEHMLCVRSIFCPPSAAPPLRADCVEDGGYEELPPPVSVSVSVSEPPRVPRGLSRGDGGAAPRAGGGRGEAKATTTLAVEQEVVVPPATDGGGVGAGAWFALACESVYGKATNIAEDYTSRLARDAFCLHCGRAFCAGVCSHHDHRGEGLPDAVVRVEERGGRRCVRCTGTEWWTAHMDGALGDPVHAGEDELGQYYELLPVVRFEHGNCLSCGGAVPRLPSTFCSDLCNQTNYREGKPRRAAAAGRLGTPLWLLEACNSN